MSKRIAGEGSVRERPDGRWEARVRLPDGRRKSAFAPTAAAANVKRLAILESIRQGLPVPDERLTVASFMATWLGAHGPSVRASTRRGYADVIEHSIIPALGTKKIAKLTAREVQTWLNELSEKKSPRTVQLARTVLRMALQQGLEWGDVTRNVADLTHGPKVERASVHPWDTEECEAFLAGMMEHRLQALYLCALTLGLRQGELLGLRWGDVDLARGELRVVQARIRGTQEYGPPKSAQSRRVMSLPDMTIEALRAHRERQANERTVMDTEWVETGLVFVTGRGTGIDGTNLTRDFHQAIARLKLRRIRFHDLRHSCASLLLAHGVSLREIMEWLGHSQISLTANTYSHVMPAAKKQAAAAMHSALTPKSPNSDPHQTEIGSAQRENYVVF